MLYLMIWQLVPVKQSYVDATAWIKWMDKINLFCSLIVASEVMHANI